MEINRFNKVLSDIKPIPFLQLTKIQSLINFKLLYFSMESLLLISFSISKFSIFINVIFDFCDTIVYLSSIWNMSIIENPN